MIESNPEKPAYFYDP